MGLGHFIRRVAISALNSQTIRTHPIQKTRSFLAFALLLLVLASPAGISAARADEVDCESLRLNIASAAYDSTCEIVSGATDVIEVLEGNATDGSHFLVVIDHVANYRYIFTGGGTLQSGLKDYFSALTVDKWRAGSVRNGFKTAEFVSDFKTIPSDCVAFERYIRKDHGGWRRRIIGFGCSRTGDREQVYQAMDQVNFPE